MANSAHDAIRKEKKIKPDDVYVDNDWAQGKLPQLASAIGFEMERVNE